jgi:light-regulated signal transduction histidine kinase (bacteriophytochrome)
MEVMIEARSRNEIESLGNKIEETCGEKYEVHIQKQRIPRLVLLSIPEDITLENAKKVWKNKTQNGHKRKGHQSKILLHY